MSLREMVQGGGEGRGGCSPLFIVLTEQMWIFSSEVTGKIYLTAAVFLILFILWNSAAKVDTWIS